MNKYLWVDKDSFDFGEDMTVYFNSGSGGSKDYVEYLKTEQCRE